MTPKPTCASVGSEIYEVLRYSASHRQPLAATYGGQPRLLCPHVGGRKSGGMHVLCIRLEEVVIVPRRWRQKATVSGDASRWRNSPQSSCVRIHGVPSHVPRDRPALMKSISIPTFSLEAIHKRGSEATVAATSVPERCEWSRSSVGYDALGVRGDPRGRKFGGGPAAANPR
jgi:hypothetical protein